MTVGIAYSCMVKCYTGNRGFQGNTVIKYLCHIPSKKYIKQVYLVTYLIKVLEEIEFLFIFLLGT